MFDEWCHYFVGIVYKSMIVRWKFGIILEHFKERKCPFIRILAKLWSCVNIEKRSLLSEYNTAFSLISWIQYDFVGVQDSWIDGWNL